MQTKPLKLETRRNHDARLLAIAKAFSPAPVTRIENTCANIRWDVEGERETFYQEVSAPYLLARLCAMFPGLQIETGGQENYKTTWTTVLVHKQSGHVVTFYDWKGASSYGSDVSGKDTPRAFLSDLRKLLAALSNDRFPHPYDGCAIGELA